MNKELIRDLAITGGIYDCICDPYDKLKNGDPYSSVMIDLERFAEKIVQECIQTLRDNTPVVDEHDSVEDWDRGYIRGMVDCEHHIKEHFGIE